MTNLGKSARLLFLGVMVGQSPAAQAATLQAEARTVVQKGDFGFQGKKKHVDKIRSSLSGIACVRQNDAHRCLVVFDEGGEARQVVFRDRVFEKSADPIVLLEGDIELDAEGAATDGSYAFVAGSHSVKRTTCEENPDSRFLLRFKLDGNGAAARDTFGRLVDIKKSDRLFELLKGNEALAPSLNKCLGTLPPEKAPELMGERGFNIEGLATNSGRLYFGLRGPAQDGNTYLISIKHAEFFEGKDADLKVTKIEVGPSRGIRDMQFANNGLLLLAGPDDDNGAGVTSTILFAATEDLEKELVSPTRIAELDLKAFEGTNGKPAKPESIAILEETPGNFLVLILADGAIDGGPKTFRVPR
jgi:hypothetical protein